MGPRWAVPTSGRTRRSMARRAAPGPIAMIGRSATTPATGKLGLLARRLLPGRLFVRMRAIRPTGSIASSRTEARPPSVDGNPGAAGTSAAHSPDRERALLLLTEGTPSRDLGVNDVDERD